MWRVAWHAGWRGGDRAGRPHPFCGLPVLVEIFDGNGPGGLRWLLALGWVQGGCDSDVHRARGQMRPSIVVIATAVSIFAVRRLLVGTASGGSGVPLPFAPAGQRLNMPFLEWLNATRSILMDATAVASSCSSSSRRCAPDWVIAGTGNAGSTALYMQLVQHPQLVPTRVKEVNHLGLHSNWLDRGKYAARLAPASGRLRAGELLGEASPYYLSNPVAPSQLRYLAPRAKVILVLRSPPAHCWSASSAAVTATLDAEQNFSPQRDRNSERDAVCHVVERAPARILANYHPCAAL